MIRSALTASAFVTVAFLSACATSGPATSDTVAPEVDAVVEMSSLLRFSPETVTIRSGDTVEWRNKAVMHHTVTTLASEADDPSQVLIPEGAEAFDSGEIDSGGIYRHTFTTPGEYDYICEPHDKFGMHGKVIVTAS